MVLLLLADWGVSTLSEILHEMLFVDPPEEQSLERAEWFLFEIRALERFKDHQFTISKMPCHPRLAACISEAIQREDENHADADAVLAASIAVAFCLDNESPIGDRDCDRDRWYEWITVSPWSMIVIVIGDTNWRQSDSIRFDNRYNNE